MLAQCFGGLDCSDGDAEGMDVCKDEFGDKEVDKIQANID